MEINNKYHLELLRELKKHSGQGTKYQKEREKNYIGTDKFCYCIKSSVKKQIVKDWIKKHKDLTSADYVCLLDSLYSGDSHDERSLAGKLLQYLPKLKQKLSPSKIDKWLERAKGWAEVDSVCQSNFSGLEIINQWENWESLIKQLSKSKNVHKRRASLVLLTKPLRDIDDIRIAKLAITIIDRLKSEKDILITKAVSWLLRDLIKNHRSLVESYLRDNSDHLPKIAIRETKRKLLTGRK